MGPKYEIVSFWWENCIYLRFSMTPDFICRRLQTLSVHVTDFISELAQNNNESDLWFGQCVYLLVTKVKVRKYYGFLGLS